MAISFYEFTTCILSFLYTVPIYDWHKNARCRNCGKAYDSSDLDYELFCLKCGYSGESVETIALKGRCTQIILEEVLPNAIRFYVEIELDETYRLFNDEELDSVATYISVTPEQHIILKDERISMLLVQVK